MIDYDRLAAAAPDPENAARRLARMRGDAALRAEMDALPDAVAADLVAIVGYSAFLFNYLCRNPRAMRLLGKPCRLDREQLREADDHEALRRFKYERLLQITWMDVADACPYEVVLERLSRLADLVVEKSFQLCFAADDEALDLSRFISVFAMGKLGSGELNYSSDVDLIFACSDDAAGRDPHELQSALAVRLRRFTKALEERTAAGFLYRVDLKLRPWGKSGPLFLTVDDTENYYQASTEAWERLVWLRGRCVAGNEELGQELLSRMRPFIFMRSLSTADLDRFVVLKREMADVRERSGQWHVKLGRGGIRDIEFFIQILQLVSAARHAELQTTNTLAVLRSLRRLNFISPEDEREVREAYLFLRRLENRLQMANESQTHSLPDDEAGRLGVARSLSVAGAADDETLAEFERRLNAARQTAEKFFEKVLPEPRDAAAPAADQAPVSFAAAWNPVQAEISFTRWTELCEKQQWGDVPAEKNLLINVFGASWYFTRYIFFRGYEITELIDHYQDQPADAAAMAETLQAAEFKKDVKEGLRVLSSVKNQWMLLLLIRFLQGDASLAELERSLTALAECVFAALVEQLAGADGPLSEDVAVLAMGRMAGFEMIFGSDLDLIFLYRSSSSAQASQISQQLQGLLRHLAAVSPAGLLYEVDMRLRPHGASGSLITSADSFVEYHQSERAVWERQMMTRCRPIHDPGDMGAAAMQEITGSIYGDHDEALLRDEIVKMRRLIEETLGRPRRKHEIKRGPGGLMDIDFITHFLQLAHGARHETLRTASTRQALARLAQLNLLGAERADLLLESYDFLKRIEVCLRLIDLKPASAISVDGKQNEALARGMGFEAGRAQDFMDEFAAVAARVRGEFNDLVGPME